MSEIFSKLIFIVTMMFCGVALLFSAGWLDLIYHRDAFGGYFFAHLFAPIFCGSIFLLGILPSGIMFFRTRRARDYWSLWLSAYAFGIVVVETIALQFIPLKAQC